MVQVPLPPETATVRVSQSGYLGETTALDNKLGLVEKLLSIVKSGKVNMKVGLETKRNNIDFFSPFYNKRFSKKITKSFLLCIPKKNKKLMPMLFIDLSKIIVLFLLLFIIKLWLLRSASGLLRHSETFASEMLFSLTGELLWSGSSK